MFRVESLIQSGLKTNRAVLALTIYAILVEVAYATAYLIRFDFLVPPHYVRVMLWTSLAVIAVRLFCFRVFNISRGRWRYVSTRDALRLGFTTALGTAFIVLLNFALPLPRRIPLSVVAIESLLTSFFIAAAWLTYRVVFEHNRRKAAGKVGKRVVVIGAGEAGNLLAREICRFPTGYELVGFVDDNPAMWGASLHGVEVIGASTDLEAIAREVRAEELIIAMPSATPQALTALVERCERTGLSFKVLPGIAQVLAGDVRVGHLREVRIEDLLGREPVSLHLPELAEDLGDKVVLITGAAGSIGSELARQVALHAPSTLILLDQAETPLFYLELDLRSAHPDLMIRCMVGDIVNPATMDRVFARCSPDVVFHAAAYKHVPMMENNPREAVRNNVIGTWRVANAAGQYGARKFVLVSTDKAVTPANVMGASKRLAEMVTLELQNRYPGTSFSAVRFGNVLGSAGSVVPVFKRLLANNQPLTVTHPDVTRFFMTIPEAVQLILQASLMPELRGHIAMLEMGEPVRIADLATNLLRLSGYSENPAQRIVFTGLRPGEKLHEELVAPDEKTIATEIDKVRIIRGNGNGQHGHIQIETWERAVELGTDSELLKLMQRVFPSLAGAAGPLLARAEYIAS